MQQSTDHEEGETCAAGTVPDAWYNLTGLKSLKAFATGVSGSLPASWARTGLTPASSLSVLDLGSTKVRPRCSQG